MREGDRAGVLLHGMGRLGKSSLASRIANRRRKLGLWWCSNITAHWISSPRFPRPYIATQMRGNYCGSVPELVTGCNRLEDVLTDLISGPCAQAGDGASVLLVIDDLEQIRNAGPAGGRHRIVPTYAPVIQAILRAFDPMHTDSRLVITSRFPFVLDEIGERLFELQLPPLSAAAQLKLQRRQLESAVEKGLTDDPLAERVELLKKVPMIARGNPGLQDLIGPRFFSTAVPVEHATQVLKEMQDWLARGELPSDAEVRAFVENLAIDALIELSGATGIAFLARFFI